MNPCEKRRKALMMLAGCLVTGPAVVPTAQANPLVFALRTLLTRHLTRRQTQAISQRASQAITHEQLTATLWGTRLGMALRKSADSFRRNALRDSLGALESAHDNSPQQAFADGLYADFEWWDQTREHTLYLRIPPLAQAIENELYVVAVDLRTGYRTQIGEPLPVVLAPSPTVSFVPIPVGHIPTAGLYTFDALIPALAGQIVIEQGPPILVA